MPEAANNVFLEYLEKYDQDWLGLARDVLHFEPDPEQADIIVAAQNHERRVSVRSGHGVGKTTALAICIVCHVCTRFPQRTVATAPTSSQLFDALYSETCNWMRKLPPALFDRFEITSARIELKAAPGESFVAFNTSRPEVPEAMAGVHADNVLLIADEASGVPQQVFEAASGSMSGHNATTILAGNPVRTSGLFFDSHNSKRDQWHAIHISCIGHPRISQDFIDSMREQYGADSNVYRVRVLGEFPRAGDNAVIPLELAEMALHRDVQATAVKPIWGVDVARFGDDKSSLAKRKGNVLLQKVNEWSGLNTMQLVSKIKMEYDITPPHLQPSVICVDVIGLGAGVVDRCQELGLPVRGVNVSESPAMADKYRNLRAELHFLGREWFEARDCAICADTDLMNEAIAPTYKMTSSGKIQVESKEEMKKRGRKSPNKWDAFLLTFAETAVSVAHGSKFNTTWNKPLEFKLKSLC